MNTALAQALLALAGIYLGVGLLFAIAFVARGAGRIDHAAASGTPGFRLLILPGAAALWPLLARRWIAAQPGPPEQRDAHAVAAQNGADAAAAHDGARA